MQSNDAKTHRKQLGLSQVKLARMAGVSRHRYIMWELGNDPLTVEELRLIEHVLERLAAAQIETLGTFARAEIPNHAA
jgi:transcriptional regulator with XRE-family HTH domain